jgi:translation initiation factor eIF-2B subunit delta
MSTPAAAAAPKKEKKGPPAGLVIPPKKPKLTKAERRALQEQQRAAKSSDGHVTSKEGVQATTTTTTTTTVSTTAKEKPEAQAGASPTTVLEPLAPRLSMVSHLTPYRDVSQVFSLGATLQTISSSTAESHTTTTTTTNKHLHPAVLALGYRYAAGEIRGANARCRHMLACWATVIRDFVPPTKGEQQQDLRQVMETLLKTSFQFWTESCRPHSVSMGNAYTMLKMATASLDRRATWEELRALLLDTMKAYAQERIDYAGQAIAELACRKVLPALGAAPAQVILTYGYSEVVALVLKQAIQEGKHFSVICVDSPPLLEGRRLLEELCEAGRTDCTYILLNALTYVLPTVTTVFLGAAALMSDGAVWNRVGTAQVALLAHAHNIPVLVCAESHKISHRVQLEALTHNEIGAPPRNPAKKMEDERSSSGPSNLMPLNLLYDLTPASFVSGIVTELGIVPPTSVAVLLRELNSQLQA